MKVMILYNYVLSFLFQSLQLNTLPNPGRSRVGIAVNQEEADREKEKKTREKKFLIFFSSLLLPPEKPQLI